MLRKKKGLPAISRATRCKSSLTRSQASSAVLCAAPPRRLARVLPRVVSLQAQGRSRRQSARRFGTMLQLNPSAPLDLLKLAEVVVGNSRCHLLAAPHRARVQTFLLCSASDQNRRIRNRTARRPEIFSLGATPQPRLISQRLGRVWPLQRPTNFVLRRGKAQDCFSQCQPQRSHRVQ